MKLMEGLKWINWSKENYKNNYQQNIMNNFLINFNVDYFYFVVNSFYLEPTEVIT